MEVNLLNNKFSVFHEEAKSLRKQRKDERKAEKALKRLEEEQEEQDRFYRQISEGRLNRRSILNWADLSDDDCFYDTAETLVMATAKMNNEKEKNSEDTTSSDTSSEISSSGEEATAKDGGTVVQAETSAALHMETDASTHPKNADSKKAVLGKVNDLKNLSKKERKLLKAQELEQLELLISQLNHSAADGSNVEQIGENPVAHQDITAEATSNAPSSTTMKKKKKKKPPIKGLESEQQSSAVDNGENKEVPIVITNTIDRNELKKIATKTKKKNNESDEIKKMLAEEAKEKKNLQKHKKKDKFLFPKTMK